MTKTRSQTGSIAIKNEEEDCKPTLLLNGVSNTRSNNKIAKRRPSIINSRHLPAPQVKEEQDADTKLLLKLGARLPKPRISQAQINQLIDYIVNHNMTVNKAAREVNISYPTGLHYYKVYKNNPEKKIPVPRKQFWHPRKYYTQEQIGNLIRYIDTDKMTVKEASTKADLPYSSARRYYTRYLNDPNHNIPILQKKQFYTQDQKNEFIGYIVNDKMSIVAASENAKMHIRSAKMYYHRYFKEQNPDIATPSHITTRKCCTQDQKNDLIDYIVNDKMSIAAASKKAKMSLSAAQRFYHNYFKVQNPDVSTPSHIVTPRRFTQEQLNEAMYYITNDKMSITAASKKANVRQTAAGERYRQYLKDHNMKVPVTKTRKHYTQDQINVFLKYIVEDKLTIAAASKKANVCKSSGHRYYHQYLNDQMRNRLTRPSPVASAP